MNEQDWTPIGEELKESIEYGMKTGDYSKMAGDVARTVGDAINIVAREANRYSGLGQTHRASERVGRNRENMGLKIQRERIINSRFKKADSLMTGKTLKIIGGAALTGFGFFTELGFAIAQGFVGHFALPMAVVAIPLVGGIYLLKKGIEERKQVKRFSKYVKAIEDKEYINVSDLASYTGISVDQIRKDVRKMVDEGWIINGFMDEKQTILTVTEEAKRAYLDALNSYKSRLAENSAISDSKASSDEKALPEEVRQVLKEGRDYVREIRRSNDAIPGVEISQKISRLERAVDQIFDRVEAHPELVDSLRKFMKYYLPTTVKLLNAYENLDQEEIQGPNVIKSKQEIEKTLDTIIEAFENLLDSFFEDDAVDIKSDIDVMQTLMAQEGLLGR